MGYAFRTLFVDHDDRLRPVTAHHFGRLASGGLVSPELAGRTMRSAHVAVELAGGRPTGWVHEDYVLLRFAPDGSLAHGDALMRVRLALAATLDEGARVTPAGVAAARAAISNLTRARRGAWEPDEHLRARILALARSRC